MRLIDADKLKRRVQSVATEAWKTKLEAKVETTLNQFLDYVEQSPTIDAVRVVRCKDCKYGEYRADYDDYECNASGCGLVYDAEYFCAEGEREGEYRHRGGKRGRVMSDLIKRSDAIEAIEGTDWYHINRDGDLVSGARSDGTALYKAGDVYKALEAVPSARPNGEWIWHEDDDICNCSECEFEIDATGCIEPMEYVGVFRYCPNCGARMKGEDDE